VTISGKSPPIEVGSTVVDMDSNSVDAPTVDGLIDRNYACVYRYAFRLAGCGVTAEDITQNVFVRAIAHLHQLRESAAERGWIMSITRREFMRWLREVGNPAHGRSAPLDVEQLLKDDKQAERLENRDWVQSALGLLGEDVRVALLMYYFEDLSYAEIAQQLQIPIGTVMSRLSRGREHLRQALDRLNRDSAVNSSTKRASVSKVLDNIHTLPANADKTLVQPTAKPTAREAKHG
jgi:RNA polymerase sigma-70 factor, ECF subfamily